MACLPARLWWCNLWYRLLHSPSLVAVRLSVGYEPGGGVLPMWWVIHMCRGFDPLFSLWQDRARSFWGIFSHPPTPKRSFGILKLPILKEFDLLGPKFNFSLDLFGSNFQGPAAHPHQFSDRVPPPGGMRHGLQLAGVIGWSRYKLVLPQLQWIVG